MANWKGKEHEEWKIKWTVVANRIDGSIDFADVADGYLG